MPLPRPPKPIRTSRLPRAVQSAVEDRDLACRVCHAPDRKRFIGTLAHGLLPKNAVDLVLYIIPAYPHGAGLSSADVCRLCRACKAAVNARTVGIAGNANGTLAIDKWDTTDFQNTRPRAR